MKQLTEQFAQSVVRPRARDTYKGSFGKILIVGGNAHFGGAAIMSASAAVYAGAGWSVLRLTQLTVMRCTPDYLRQ